MKKTVESLFAITSPGLEEVCASELRSLAMAGVRPVRGGVEFTGDLRDLYRANLWLRTATRVVVRAGELRCRDFPELFRRTARLPWGRFIRPGAPVRIRVSSRRSRLIHTDRIAETVAEGISHALGTPAPKGSAEAEQLLLVRLEEDLCRFSVDSSGELLHRRGYRTESGPAPLRETLAAGLLHLLGWNGGIPLFDPLCGSGTIPIEGALLALGQPPGGGRDFAFMQWPGWRPGLWRTLLQEAGQGRGVAPAAIRGADRDGDVLALARANAERAGVLPVTGWEREELAEARPFAPVGLLVCNPPYGARLEGGEDLRPFFHTLGEICRRFPGWRAAFLVPDEVLARATGIPFRVVARLVNGGIPVILVEARP